MPIPSGRSGGSTASDLAQSAWSRVQGLGRGAGLDLNAPVAERAVARLGGAIDSAVESQKKYIDQTKRLAVAEKELTSFLRREAEMTEDLTRLRSLGAKATEEQKEQIRRLEDRMESLSGKIGNQRREMQEANKELSEMSQSSGRARGALAGLGATASGVAAIVKVFGDRSSVAAGLLGRYHHVLSQVGDVSANVQRVTTGLLSNYGDLRIEMRRMGYTAEDTRRAYLQMVDSMKYDLPLESAGRVAKGLTSQFGAVARVLDMDIGAAMGYATDNQRKFGKASNETLATMVRLTTGVQRYNLVNRNSQISTSQMAKAVMELSNSTSNYMMNIRGMSGVLSGSVQAARGLGVPQAQAMSFGKAFTRYATGETTPEFIQFRAGKDMLASLQSRLSSGQTTLSEEARKLAGPGADETKIQHMTMRLKHITQSRNMNPLDRATGLFEIMAGAGTPEAIEQVIEVAKRFGNRPGAGPRVTEAVTGLDRHNATILWSMIEEGRPTDQLIAFVRQHKKTEGGKTVMPSSFMNAAKLGLIEQEGLPGAAIEMTKEQIKRKLEDYGVKAGGWFLGLSTPEKIGLGAALLGGSAALGGAAFAGGKSLYGKAAGGISNFSRGLSAGSKFGRAYPARVGGLAKFGSELGALSRTNIATRAGLGGAGRILGGMGGRALGALGGILRFAGLPLTVILSAASMINSALSDVTEEDGPGTLASIATFGLSDLVDSAVFDPDREQTRLGKIGRISTGLGKQFRQNVPKPIQSLLGQYGFGNVEDDRKKIAAASDLRELINEYSALREPGFFGSPYTKKEREKRLESIKNKLLDMKKAGVITNEELSISDVRDRLDKEASLAGARIEMLPGLSRETTAAAVSGGAEQFGKLLANLRTADQKFAAVSNWMKDLESGALGVSDDKKELFRAALGKTWENLIAEEKEARMGPLEAQKKFFSVDMKDIFRQNVTDPLFDVVQSGMMFQMSSTEAGKRALANMAQQGQLGAGPRTSQAAQMLGIQMPVLGPVMADQNGPSIRVVDSTGNPTAQANSGYNVVGMGNQSAAN